MPAMRCGGAAPEFVLALRAIAWEGDGIIRFGSADRLAVAVVATITTEEGGDADDRGNHNAGSFFCVVLFHVRLCEIPEGHGRS